MIRAVIDTNVLVSALISSAGNEALVLLAVQQGMIRPCISDPILQEYARVQARPKFAFPPDEIAHAMAIFHTNGENVTGESLLHSPDPSDTKFLQCADVAQAEFLVTGNRRHFPHSPYGPTYVVSATEPVEAITFEL